MPTQYALSSSRVNHCAEDFVYMRGSKPFSPRGSML